MKRKTEQDIACAVVDDWIDAWHNEVTAPVSLAQWLGWTWSEYAAFVEGAQLNPKTMQPLVRK